MLQGERTDGSEQRRRFALMLASRMAVVTALLASTIYFNLRTGVLGFTASQILLYALVAGVFLVSAGYWIRFRWAREAFILDLHVQVNILLDLLVATILVYLTGGVESPFTFIYALPVISTTVFYPRRGALLTAGLSCLLLGALFVLENQGVLPVDLEGRVQELPTAGRVVYLLALNFTVFFVIALLSGYLSEQLRRTGRKLRRTESDLETLASLNRDIVHSLRSGLLVVDREEKVSLLNPVAERILDVTSQQALHRPLADVFPSLVPLLRDKRHWDTERLEVEHRRTPDGTLIPVGLTLSALKSPDAGGGGILVHMRDLTQLKEMQASVKKAEKMAALGAMAAAIAHEIRNPLASISGSVQVMNDSGNMGDEDRRLMEIILREADRLDLLLADFLAYARPKEPQPRSCSLKELVSETISVFLRGAEPARSGVVCDLDDVHAVVDPDQVRQVLWNLLTNARQAVGDQGTIRVRLATEDDGNGNCQALLEVADQGPGVARELRERVFEPFFTSREEGSGLGLAISSRIVEAHGGSIHLQCPDEGGSRFFVRLPGVEDA